MVSIRVWSRWAAVAAVGVSLLVAPLLAEEVDDGAAAPVRHVHDSTQQMTEQLLGAMRAFLAEDGPAARAALDRLEAASPPLDRYRDEAFGHEILSFDQAFHTTLDRSREYTTAGRLDSAFDQFVWVQKACITCHGMAREKGFLSSASPEGSENPSRSSGTTPSR